MWLRRSPLRLGLTYPGHPGVAPDLQGVWDVRTITPLRRPPDLAGKRVPTDEEAAEYELRAQLRRVQRRDLGLAERCLVGLSSGPPFTPGGYNNNVQLFQTPDHVVILTEMVHEARVVPLDGRHSSSTPATRGTTRCTTSWLARGSTSADEGRRSGRLLPTRKAVRRGSKTSILPSQRLTKGKTCGCCRGTVQRAEERPAIYGANLDKAV